MTFVRALLACVHLLLVCAYDVLTVCCNSCQRCVSAFTSQLYAGFVTSLIQPSRDLCILCKAVCVLVWKVAVTICTVPWRLWNSLHTWYTAWCCMLSHCLSLSEDIPCACLALLCQIYGQMQEAVLQLLWSWIPGWIQTTCTSLAPVWYSTGKEDSAPRRSSFGSFGIIRLIERAMTSSLALLLGAPSACMAIPRHIYSQLKKAALQKLWSWTPCGIQTTCALLAYLWRNTGKEGPADAPSRTASFGFDEYVVTIVRRVKPCNCPLGIPPSPSGTVLEPEIYPEGALHPAQDTHGDDSKFDQHKTSLPDTQSAGSEATKVRFSLLIVC